MQQAFWFWRLRRNLWHHAIWLPYLVWMRVLRCLAETFRFLKAERLAWRCAQAMAQATRNYLRRAGHERWNVPDGAIGLRRPKDDD